jgi:hypothetical protein
MRPNCGRDGKRARNAKPGLCSNGAAPERTSVRFKNLDLTSMDC